MNRLKYPLAIVSLVASIIFVFAFIDMSIYIYAYGVQIIAMDIFKSAAWPLAIIVLGYWLGWSLVWFNRYRPNSK